MGLEVIGAGWGRTGTESLKQALEILGYGKCYHMFELIQRTRQLPHWVALSRGEPTDLEALFRGFRSGVDFPVALYYRELMAAFPDAKVVLSMRDADDWYRSASATILRGVPWPARLAARVLGWPSPNLRGVPALFDWVQGTLHDGFFEGRALDEPYMKRRYLEWVEEVKRTVPADRLVVMDVKDGWGPLCAGLGVGVPDVPFPRSNDRNAMAERIKPWNFLREFWNGAP